MGSGDLARTAVAFEMTPRGTRRDRGVALLVRLLMAAAVVMAALGFYADLRKTLSYGLAGIDLRNRIVGARLLSAGLDPYYFQWTPEHSEALLDPLHKPASPITRTSVPPSVLVLLAPIASLHYGTIRLLWLALEWAALLLSLGLLATRAPSRDKAIVVWIIGLAFVSGSYAWHSHTEVGQTYILYVLLLAIAYSQLGGRHRLSGVASGLLIGVTASLRLPFLLMGFPLVIYRQWKLLAGSVIGFVLGISLSIVIGGTEVWRSYFSAMRVHSLLQYQGGEWPYRDFPKRVEGVTVRYDFGDGLGSGDTSILYLFHRYLGINIATGLLPVLAAVVLIGACILYAHRRYQPSASLVFQMALVLVFVCDFFLPAGRVVYQDVIWLMLLALVIINAESLHALATPLLALAVVGLCLSVGFIWMPYRIELMETAMVAYFVLVTLGLLRKNGQAGAIVARARGKPFHLVYDPGLDATKGRPPCG